mmetsp:Transcript_33320/g.59825  ORF Transcript_33320/g.59825 Transcript_33320/m.59825 type:complete len:333 (+) Transcript_33320:1650-2648(+)
MSHFEVVVVAGDHHAALQVHNFRRHLQVETLDVAQASPVLSVQRLVQVEHHLLGGVQLLAEDLEFVEEEPSPGWLRAASRHALEVRGDSKGRRIVSHHNVLPAACAIGHLGRSAPSCRAHSQRFHSIAWCIARVVEAKSDTSLQARLLEVNLQPLLVAGAVGGTPAPPARVRVAVDGVHSTLAPDQFLHTSGGSRRNESPLCGWADANDLTHRGCAARCRCNSDAITHSPAHVNRVVLQEKLRAPVRSCSAESRCAAVRGRGCRCVLPQCCRGSEYPTRGDSRCPRLCRWSPSAAWDSCECRPGGSPPPPPRCSLLGAQCPPSQCPTSGCHK